MKHTDPILPGSTIGMIGGGQLGRMFAVAASAMGYRVVVLCESDDSPAAQVACEVVVGGLDDSDAIERFAARCDVITLEFENIPAETLSQCSSHAPTYPAHRVLAIAQDRLLEKTTLQDAGLSVTPFAPVSDNESLIAASETLGWPLVVKTARDGYDGKGQYKIEGPEQVNAVDWSIASTWIAEKWIAYSKEVSVVVAISALGESKAFPVFENDHRNHILDVSTSPAKIDPSVEAKACEVALQAAKTLGAVGLLCVEFFVVDGDVIINEVAPRPHNSGHLTIEANHTSQFQQHVRAVCGLPLGNTAMRCKSAAMINLLGELWPPDGVPEWSKSMEDADIQLHLYGKSAAKVGRKMGHITIVGEDLRDVKQRAVGARARLERK